MAVRRVTRQSTLEDGILEGDNHIFVTTTSDNERTGQASGSRRRGRKLTKTETRPRQQWSRSMERVLVKIMSTEKRKGKGFMARTKEQWDIRMPEYDFLSMKNLRDKFAKIDECKIHELLQEEDHEPVGEGGGELYQRTNHNYQEAVTSNEVCEEVDELTEVNEEDLTEYEKTLLEKTKELIESRVNDCKVIRFKKTPRKEQLMKIDHAAVRVWTVLKNRLKDVNDVWKVNCLTYGIHLLYVESIPGKNKGRVQEKNREDSKMKEIKALRRWISIIDNEIYWKTEKNYPTRKQLQNSCVLRYRYGRRTIKGWKAQKFRLIERLRILVARRKRQQKQEKRQKQNATFKRSPKAWFSNANKEGSQREETIISDRDAERILNFWSHMWDHKEHNKEWTTWKDSIEEDIKQVTRGMQDNSEIEMTDLKKVLKKASPMKAAGPDGIPMYWWKNLKSLHPEMLRIIKQEITGESLDDWLFEGKTFLFTKKGKDEKDEGGKRPITCLNTFYKIESAIVATKLGEFMTKTKVYPIEQRGGVGENMGCREQVIVDDAIHAEVKHHKRDLAEAWIDLRKAYDSIHKDWLIDGLQVLGVPDWIVKFVEKASGKWNTTIIFKANGKIFKSKKIQIQRGIFQGDSLSPLLFCACIIPVTFMLRKMRLGYMFGPTRRRTLRRMITHLLFMDDMKIYAVLMSNLRKMLNGVAEMFGTIGLELGEEKCAVQQFKHGKKVAQNGSVQLDVGKAVTFLNTGSSYPYLGFLQEESIEHRKIKDELSKEFKKKCKMIWKAELNARNKVQAYNELAVNSLTYTFGVVHWTREELEELDVSNRKIMHMAQCLHPRAATERLYLERDEGGRGLLNILELHDRISAGLAVYITICGSIFMESVKEHEMTKWSGTRLKECVTTLERYGIEAAITDDGAIEVEGEFMKPKKVSQLIRRKAKIKRKLALEEKHLHGQFWTTIRNQNASKKTWQWLKDGKVDGSIEATLMAIQDGVLWTRNYQKTIGMVDVVDTCRLCGEPKENLAHLLASCKGLLGSVLKERHDDCVRAIYVKACWELGLLREQNKWWEKQAVQPVIENDQWCVLWDHAFITDRTIEYTRPDIVFENKVEKEGFIVEVGICLEQNLQTKLTEKRSKYVRLAMEISKLRRWRTWKIVPVVVGVTGTMTHDCDELVKIPGIGKVQRNELLKEMQKIVIYKAVTIVRHVLNN